MQNQEICLLVGTRAGALYKHQIGQELVYKFPRLQPNIIYSIFMAYDKKSFFAACYKLGLIQFDMKTNKCIKTVSNEIKMQFSFLTYNGRYLIT